MDLYGLDTLPTELYYKHTQNELRKQNPITLNFEMWYESNEDIFNMLMYAELYKDMPKTLTLHYMPYNRADRPVDNKLPAIEPIVSLINNVGFIKVLVVEPHNAAVIWGINNLVIHTPIDKWAHIIECQDIDTICLPDAGALKRYEKELSIFAHMVDIISADKVRNPQTGHIESLYLTKKPKPGAKVLIIDDLCSKGGTFMRTALALQHTGASEIYLYVAYCEDTVYTGDLLQEYSPLTHMYTSNILLTPTDKLSII
jgi:ribose-phosphate pyrophosphokinase